MKKSMLFVFLLGGFGCDDSTSPVVEKPVLSDFDQSCVGNDECEIVNIDPCGCSCSDAVNLDVVSEVEAATANITCETPLDCQACDAVPRCLAGKCETRVPYIIRAEDFATNCETAADCRLVLTGEACPRCGCHDAIVNAADYDAKVPEQECGNPPGSECNNCIEPEAACTNNVCVLVDRI
jgi:hypothetical protein